mmetsp:Transcript_12018/g.28160  ORF Transcript_12018/g.28160 Transcript_12018/m.28160 type:complete len:340 (-) Transcript_12018:179-1198(-)
MRPNGSPGHGPAGDPAGDPLLRHPGARGASVARDHQQDRAFARAAAVSGGHDRVRGGQGEARVHFEHVQASPGGPLQPGGRTVPRRRPLRAGHPGRHPGHHLPQGPVRRRGGGAHPTLPASGRGEPRARALPAGRGVPLPRQLVRPQKQRVPQRGAVPAAPQLREALLGAGQARRGAGGAHQGRVLVLTRVRARAREHFRWVLPHGVDLLRAAPHRERFGTVRQGGGHLVQVPHRGHGAPSSRLDRGPPGPGGHFGTDAADRGARHARLHPADARKAPGAGAHRDGGGAVHPRARASPAGEGGRGAGVRRGGGRGVRQAPGCGAPGNPEGNGRAQAAHF